MRQHVMCLLVVALGTAICAQAKELPPSTASVVAELKAGNDRHVSGHYVHPDQTIARRQELSKGQEPNAIILTCADSRVAPEIVFDQGLGSLFDIRVAGNIATDEEIGSIEYAAEHLHSRLVVVMGHQKCGAVSAVVSGGEAHGHIPSLIKAIQPAVDKAKGMPGDPVENSVRTNVELVVEQLRTSKPILHELVKNGKLQIVGAIYSLDTGKVTWLSE